MRRRLSEYWLFLGEFLRNNRTTGAILPSGRPLASALARYVDMPGGPRRILEVGPGTGAVTRRIVAALQPEDTLDLVELNASFVRRLHHRFQTEPAFRSVAGRARLFHCAVEELPQDGQYDLVISGLPLNNFSVAEVERILQVITGLLKQGGTFSFFQYIALRYVGALLSGRAERARLRGIGQTLAKLLSAAEIRRDWVWPNVPPAWVHHVRFG